MLPGASETDIIGSMFTIDLEEPEQVLEYLGPMLHDVYEAIDHGVSLAESKMSDLSPDAFLWAHMVRFGARQWLDRTEATDWEQGRNLANSGIELRRTPLVVRVVKALDGGPPHPGVSGRKRAFWMQQNERLPLAFGKVAMPKVCNFLLDWNVGASQDIELALSKPNGEWRFKDNPRLAWRRQVVLTKQGQRFSSPEERDLDVAAVIDEAEFGMGAES